MGLRGYDERWMVLDTDHCVEGTHQAGFVATLHEAKRRGVKAILRAERLDATVGGGDIPLGNTTRIYRLLKSIAARVFLRSFLASTGGLFSILSGVIQHISRHHCVLL
jgi:hypothetical protein